MDGFVGVTAIDTSVGAAIVSDVEPVTVFSVAEIVDVPAATLVANPCVPAALLIVATPGTDEVQATDVVRFAVRPPVNVPVAVNCRVRPSPSDELAGVIARALRPFAFPVPLTVTIVGLPNALWVKAIVPARGPTAVGVNVTPIVHVAPAATPPHVFDVTAKSPVAAAPETVNTDVN